MTATVDSLVSKPEIVAEAKRIAEAYWQVIEENGFDSTQALAYVVAQIGALTATHNNTVRHMAILAKAVEDHAAVIQGLMVRSANAGLRS